jgi:hypothetical protein
MKFSQRIGKNTKSELIQINNMDEALKNRLFNVVEDLILAEHSEQVGHLHVTNEFLSQYCD